MTTDSNVTPQSALRVGAPTPAPGVPHAGGASPSPHTTPVPAPTSSGAGTGAAAGEGNASFGTSVPALCAVGILIVGQLYTVLPVLDDLAGSWSTSTSAAGWATTAFGFGYAAGFLFSGPLSDRFGRRRLIVTGLLITALATVAVTLAPNLVVGCAIRAVQGLAAATFAPAAFAYIAERVEPARRVAAMTWLTSSFLSAGVLGQVFSQSVAEAWNWQTVFLICAAAMVGGAVLLRTVLLPDRDTATTSALDAYRAMGRLLTKPSLVLFLLATLTLLCGFVAAYTALQLMGPGSLSERPDAMLLLRASSLPAMVLVPLVTPFLVRLPAARRVVGALLLAGAVSGATALLAAGDGLGLVTLGALMFVFVFGIAVTAPALVEAIGSQAGAARGAAVALYTFTLFVGASLGPLLATSAGDSFATVSAVIAGVLCAGAALAAAGQQLRR
ncbi:MFS transporter [Streptomyces yaizuensis]|uniref:MFS transporter n=1 Tax=Streptomyces yaizuensis TaxID=2989713 RepID=A0ABQ5PAT1_9ACTN|nr:MFS transporter [Streptomyces sp. YSPA8]GLF99336.1 MFS transporter [Streptomyces sp. YSPA8]